MPFLTLKTRLARHTRLAPALVDCRHVAWDGHSLMVISKFDVLRV